MKLRLNFFKFFICLSFAMVISDSNAFNDTDYLSLTNKTPYNLYFKATWESILCSDDSGNLAPGQRFRVWFGACELTSLFAIVHTPHGDVQCTSPWAPGTHNIILTTPNKCYFTG